jgi:hypothetical protein
VSGAVITKIGAHDHQQQTASNQTLPIFHSQVDTDPNATVNADLISICYVGQSGPDLDILTRQPHRWVINQLDLRGYDADLRHFECRVSTIQSAPSKGASEK